VSKNESVNVDIKVTNQIVLQVSTASSIPIPITSATATVSPTEPKVQADTPAQKDIAKAFQPCRCKKSGCLKLYCECLKFGRVCSKECACVGCKNCEGNLERKQFLDQIRNRQELTLKPGEVVEDIAPGAGGIAKIAQGVFCRCKKS
jgi:hypothetical protein